MVCRGGHVAPSLFSPYETSQVRTLVSTAPYCGVRYNWVIIVIHYCSVTSYDCFSNFILSLFIFCCSFFMIFTPYFFSCILYHSSFFSHYSYLIPPPLLNPLIDYLLWLIEFSLLLLIICNLFFYVMIAHHFSFKNNF